MELERSLSVKRIRVTDTSNPIELPVGTTEQEVLGLCHGRAAVAGPTKQATKRSDQPKQGDGSREWQTAGSKKSKGGASSSSQSRPYQGPGDKSVTKADQNNVTPNSSGAAGHVSGLQGGNQQSGPSPPPDQPSAAESDGEPAGALATSGAETPGHSDVGGSADDTSQNVSLPTPTASQEQTLSQS